ncbi:Sulfotransferase 1C2A [Holothuria leucospilota]|uniref:Sulfotransferase 1C2A n=1 Tax=Holothuria leucospilota TaxID=206669 RepID=A0A9Q1H3Y3_HOLLE|nr:Sulfotransferase 1C2A [Holothuria leucospilota]
MSEDSAKLQPVISLTQAKSKEDIVPLETGKHKYKGYTFTAMQTPENLDALQTFGVRDDDVYLVTYPKSGTHWILEIVQLIMAGGDAQKTNRDLMATILEITFAPSPEKLKQSIPGYKIYEKLSSPRIMVSHIPEPLCPPQWFTKNAKIIYFARNPKDVLVSAYNFFQCMVGSNLRLWDGFFEKFFDENCKLINR